LVARPEQNRPKAVFNFRVGLFLPSHQLGFNRLPKSLVIMHSNRYLPLYFLSPSFHCHHGGISMPTMRFRQPLSE
jgi:hypothetical protein